MGNNKTILNFIIDHHRFSFVISLLISLPFLINVPNIKTVSSVDEFKLNNHPNYIFYEDFKKIFGNDEFFVIVFKDNLIFSKKNLTLLKEITEKLEAIEEVREVKSLANIDELQGSEEYFEVKPFLEEIPETSQEFISLKKRAVENKLYLSNFISKNAQTAALIVYTYDRPDNPNYRAALIEKTESLLEKYKNIGDKKIDFYIAGFTKINNDMSLSMEKDTSIFVPITYLLITFLIWIFFKNIRLTFIAVLNISICLGSTMGLFAITDITLNNVTTIVPSLIMALALSDTVHIFSHLEKTVLNTSQDKKKALFKVLSRVIYPCFLTSFTTAIGFGSLLTSELAPIRNFGLIASCGMIFEFLFSFLFLPPLILLCNPHKIFTIDSAEKGMNRFLRNLSEKVHNHFKMITVAGVIICLASIFLASQINVETDFVKYFKEHSPVRTSIDFVEKNMSGVGSLDISFSSQEIDAFKNPANLKLIEKVQTFINAQTGVDVTVSLVDFIKDMNESFHNEDPRYYKLPENQELISQYLLIYDSDNIDDFVNDTYDHSRLSARLSIHSSSEKFALINKIQQYINGCEATEKNDIKMRITGKAIQEVDIIHSLVKGQISSLLLAFIIIAICMFVVCNSFYLGLISLIPNLFPLLVNFGIMGAFGISLNTATSLISAVALGIVVDDTIHFISELRLQTKKGNPVSDAVHNVIVQKGRGMMSSSLIMSIGFSVLVFSNFVPTIQFGVLSALIMLTGIVGDMLLLPAILLFKR